MKRGSFSLPHATIFSLILVFACGVIILSLQTRQAPSFFENVQEQEAVQDYYFARSLVDICFSTHDSKGRMLHGQLNLSSFTDTHLQTCTSRPLRITLKDPNEAGIRTITTQPSLQSITLLPLLYQEYVLVDGKRALLRIEVPRA